MKSKDYCSRKGCMYHRELLHVRDNSCDYLMITGRSRIAQIPEKEQRRNWGACPCYTPKTRARRYGPGVQPYTYDWALGTRLYRAGATDRELAKALGCSVANVKYWRGRSGLPANRKGAAEQ
ncbi:MAG: hypothetical protein IKI69_04140 [Oscillospiraceae bacterium]|nr:hypothetical protein [Oscillospiraceae bacterium]